MSMKITVMGGCGRQADDTAGSPPVPEIPVRSGTYASCRYRPLSQSALDLEGQPGMIDKAFDQLVLHRSSWRPDTRWNIGCIAQ